MYYLHDFAHMTTATLVSSLYGNTYQLSLCTLTSKHTKLITSPGKHISVQHTFQSILVKSGTRVPMFLYSFPTHLLLSNESQGVIQPSKILVMITIYRVNFFLSIPETSLRHSRLCFDVFLH